MLTYFLTKGDVKGVVDIGISGWRDIGISIFGGIYGPEGCAPTTNNKQAYIIVAYFIYTSANANCECHARRVCALCEKLLLVNNEL